MVFKRAYMMYLGEYWESLVSLFERYEKSFENYVKTFPKLGEFSSLFKGSGTGVFL